MASADWIVIAVVFAVGVLLLGISSAMLRSVRTEHSVYPPTWPQLVDESLGTADAQLRLDLIDRLSIVDNAWSRDILDRARLEERDPQLRSAIERALGR